MDLYERFKIPAPKPFSTSLEVIVADTHNELRLIMQHHLAKLGFRNVRTSRDGSVALSEIKNKAASIIIVGDDLPNVKGLDLLKELREDTHMVRECFILLCKPSSKAEIMLALESGVDDLLVKPIAPADVLPKMRAAYATYVNPKNPERVYEYAKGCIREKKLELAKEVYNALAESAPKAARPNVGLAKIARLENDTATALKNLEIAISKNDSYVHAYAMRGEIQVEKGNISKAIEDFTKAVMLSPLNLARYQKSIEFLVEKGEVKACIKILEIGIAAGMDHPFVIERLGYCCFVEKDFPKALKYLKQAQRAEPENINYMNSLAICYRDSKMYDDSIEMYNQILKKDNDNYPVLFNKAIVLITVSKTDEAAKILRRCLKLRPDFVKAKEKLAELGLPEEG